MSTLTDSILVKAPHKKTFFFTLQAGRGIAAILVVLFHLSKTIFALDKYWGHDPLGELFFFGHAGVEFFFVLSGLIILHFHWDDLNRPERAIPYLKKRFCRIYPIYWFVLACIIPIYFFIPTFGHGHEREAGVVLSSILLIHVTSGYTILTVAWTLYHEILFYILFSLALLNRRWGGSLLFVWLIGSIFSLFRTMPATVNEFLYSPLDYFFSPLHLLFAIGMFACWAMRRGYVRAPMLCAVIGVAIFFGVALDEDYYHLLPGNSRSVAYGIGCALAMVGFMTLEMRGKLRVPRIMSFLGDASYSIYLSHLVILSLLAKLFIALGAKTHLPEMVSYAAILFITLLTGSLMHLWIEKPLFRKVSKMIKV
jgi:peptidoglycan/LPS O-acetylase OafA/YrhL